MKKIYLSTILFLMGCSLLSAQEFDIVLTSAESGTKTHQARNSITFGPNYSYTPSGGTMTAEIVEPVVAGNVSYNYTIVDPETRSLNTSYSVGTTSGSFNVNALGGATYTIPIDVAPGVAGLQPSLALTYNSFSGPGVAGYGWNINGISAITRSPQTYYHDGQSVGVDLTATDRFSLDGQRLVCISGTYGSNNSVYRTEIDNFSKVTCLTDGTATPKRFLVKTKSGKTIEYGYEGDSDQTVDGLTEEVSWYIDKVTDLYGNTIEYEYVKQSGHNYLAEITYGPNTVTFFYKQRSDIIASYLMGSMLEQRLILEKIEVKYNANVVKKYELKYNYPTSNYTRYSVLNEVIEYGIGSSRMNSTVFSYQTPDNVAFTQTEYNTSHSYVTYKSRLVTGDYNGDGKADFLCVPIPGLATWTGLKVYYGDGNDNFNLGFSSTVSIDMNKLNDIQALDLNGDGKDDILYELVNSGTSTFYYIKNNGSSFSTPVTITNMMNYSTTGINGKNRRWNYKQENDNLIVGISRYMVRRTREKTDELKNRATTADYDGDGISDIFINDRYGNWKLYSFANASGVLTSSLILRGSGTNSYMNDEILSGDFNGDGKTNIWSFDDNGVKIWKFSGSSLVQIYSSTWPTKNHHFTLGDFNADGKVDMFLYGYTTYDWSEWQVYLSTGMDFEKKFIPKKKNNLKNDYVRLGDFNGDGCTDLMVSSSDQSWTGTYFYISKNEGTDFYTNSLPAYPSASHNYYVSDYNGDGRTDFMCTDGAPAWWNGFQMYRTGTKSKMLLEKVANGLNQFTKINYKHLSEPGSPYTKGSGASFPVMDFQGALPVVSSVLSDNGRGSQNTTNYTYEGAKIHRQGKGFLCYTKQTVTDAVTNLKTENSFGYHTTKYFPMLTSTVNKYSSTTLSTVNNNWTFLPTATDVIFPYIYSSTQTNSQTGHSVTQTAAYDSYGNPTQIVKSFNNGVTETTTNVYDNNTTNWWLGRLTGSTVEYAKSGETTVSNTISFTYYSDGILKPDFIKYYEGTGLYYYKNHDYNSNGNLTQLYEYGTGVGPRQTNYIYEANGVRVKTVTDPLLHETEMFYDAYGRLSSEEDYLGNVTSYTYDNLGRIATETQPDGFITTTAYNWGLTGGPTYSCYNVQQSGNDGSVTKTWYDELAREIRNDVKGFSGSYIYTATDYNSKGQVYRISEPSTSTSPSQWNTHSYDSYGRITGITRPSGRNTTYVYGVGNSRVTETTGGKSSWKETDSQGLVTQAHDNGGDILYTYFPDGKVKNITAPGGAMTTMEYTDAARNQTKLIDPSADTIEYTYNAFGQLKSQKNARNQTTTYNYHADGRISSVQHSPGEGTDLYAYNTDEQLTGISNSTTNVSRNFRYDTHGRIDSIAETIPGSSTFSTTFDYDELGRLIERTHPSGIVETSNYNTNGYLASISAGGATRFTVRTMNARQQITAATYGSSLGFPPSGEREGGFWIGGDAYSAPAVAVKQGSTTTWYYLLRDYLGNITHVVNTSNTVTAEYSYDACCVKLRFCEGNETKPLAEPIPMSEAVREGRRRNPDDWSYDLTGEPDLIAGRGFTGHEWLPWFNLYNMNGRLYDPVVGRFLSPDENVQMPDFSQNFNRYSYCFNNPLVYTDPNGEWFFSLIFPGVGTVIDVFLWSATFDYATQAITNYVTREPGESFKDWAWKDIDWLDVGVSGVAGVATMGLDKVYKAGKISKTLYRTGQVGINAGLPAISARYDWKPASDGEKFSINRGDKFWTEYSYTVVKQYTATQTTNNIIKHWYSDKPWILNNNLVKKQVLESIFDLPASVGAGWWSDKYYDSRHVTPEPPQVPLLPEETPLLDNWWEDINNYAPNNQDIQNSLQLNKF
jgi:RHS repeat-associated protein